jgi:hypothetical protein
MAAVAARIKRDVVITEHLLYAEDWLIAVGRIR